MARHILQGNWPAFFYGQAYMGSLDASLVALAFRLVGERVESIRGVQTILYAGTIVTTMLLARGISSDKFVPIVAGALMAIPAVNVTLYTTVSLGGYGEALLIGNVLLLLALRVHSDASRAWPFLVWGVLAGLGFWGFGLTLVYIVPSAILMIRATFRSLTGRGARSRLALMIVGGLAGASAWLWSVARQGPAAFVSELLGSAIAGTNPTGVLPYLGVHALNLLLFGSTVIFGLRPPWEVHWLAWPLLPVATVFWLGVLLFAARISLREEPRNVGNWLLLGVIASLLVGFLLTPFGGDPSGRYFLPLASPLAILGAEFVTWLARRPGPAVAIGGLAGVLAFNLWGTLESAFVNPPGISTQFGPDTRVDAEGISALVPVLEELNELRGYSHYWVAYPLAFHSAERLVFVPQLPYHRDFRYTPRDDRYPPYNGMVENSPRVAYITSRQPGLDQAIREGLSAAGVSWSETTVGSYRIFYKLSEAIRPEQLDLRLPGESP
mgnify:FL=1